MKKALLASFILTFTLICSSAQAQLLRDPDVNPPPDVYMSGHPVYNPNYFDSRVNSFSRSHPTTDPDYFERNLNLRGNYQKPENTAPPGHDLRDYNPYYDRDGNLRK